MSTSELLPGLSLSTLVIVLLVAIGGLLFFLRKRGNRHPMDTPAGRAADEERRRDVEAQRDERL